MPIRVLLADENFLLIDGCRCALEKCDIDVAAVAYSLDDLIVRYRETLPEVLVVDLRFGPPEAGLDACESLLSEYPEAKIVVFSQIHHEQYLVEKAYKLGVLAFVLKNESSGILVQAIQHAAEGKVFFSPAVAQLLAHALIFGQNPEKILNRSELRVFLMVADGASPSDIARIKGVSVKTVSTLIRAVRERLHIRSPTDFTKLAIRFGLTTTEQKPKSQWRPVPTQAEAGDSG